MAIEYFDSQEDMDDAFEEEMERLQNIEDIKSEIEGEESEIEYHKMRLKELEQELECLLANDK